MSNAWTLTIDCANPRKLAGFWAEALGYLLPSAPAGFISWPNWFRHHGVPEDEWDDVAQLVDPDGIRPSLSFLKVPESKAGKNRLHIDIQAGSGRQVPAPERAPLILAAAFRLTAAGANVVGRHEAGGELDHLVLTDPEGNEFCIL